MSPYFISHDERAEIFALRAAGLSYAAISERVGRSRQCVRSVVLNNTLRPKRRLITEAEKKAIVRLHRTQPKMTQQRIARLFLVSQSSVSKALSAAYRSEKS